jgi:polypeptide N-acetylgalactosaminyltransferase
VANTWPDGIVKVLRTNERSGLIRAKLTGAMAAKGDVLIFLDAHCEVNERWYVADFFSCGKKLMKRVILKY